VRNAHGAGLLCPTRRGVEAVGCHAPVVHRDAAHLLRRARKAAPLREVDAWLDRFRHFWVHRLEALATEIARGKRNRRT